jgi:glucosamine-6-phosphate deaminase
MVVCDEDATLELRVKTVRYFKSIEKVQNEVEKKYSPAAILARRTGTNGPSR